MYVLSLCLIVVIAVESKEIERVERDSHSTWYLGMNLNPADGHIMDYTTGWADDAFIGTYKEALTKDYVNRGVWRHPVRYIALVRHQLGEVDAVKVFRFKEAGRSLLSRFQAMNPGRQIVTEGGPIQESVSQNAQNMADDPIFSVDGDLAFNWGYSGNGARIALTGGHLSGVDENDDNTHGLGNHFACNPHTGKPLSTEYAKLWPHEISVIQNSWAPTKVQGTDHGTGTKYISGPVYGNYALYVSEDATSFPEPGYKLDIEVEVVPKYKFFSDEL
jgi:hypothetical protein